VRQPVLRPTRRGGLTEQTPEDKPTRIGFIVDGDPDTDLMSALVEYDAMGVPTHSVPVPRRQPLAMVVTRHSPHGRSRLHYVQLQAPFRAQLLRQHGKVGLGAIRARYALQGAYDAANFSRLNGFQSEIDGLSYWLAFSAHKTSIKGAKDEGPVEITTTMGPVDDVALARPLNLKAIAIGTAPGGWSPEAAYRITNVPLPPAGAY